MPKPECLNTLPCRLPSPSVGRQGGCLQVWSELWDPAAWSVIPVLHRSEAQVPLLVYVVQWLKKGDITEQNKDGFLWVPHGWASIFKVHLIWKGCQFLLIEDWCLRPKIPTWLRNVCPYLLPLNVPLKDAVVAHSDPQLWQPQVTLDRPLISVHFLL